MTPPASPMRPAAFMRGAIRKATCPAVGVSPSAKPAESSSALSPGLRTADRPFSPCLTRMRFSPASGTTSATVPIATSFRKDSSTRCRRSEGHSSDRNNASASLKTTPTPHKFFSGYGQSSRFGLSTARAGGRAASGRWWSVTMTSMPSAPARATASAERMPVSALTSSLTPESAACSTTSTRMP